MKEPFLEPIVRNWRFAKVWAEIKPNSVVVDIGCGHTPRFLNRLKSHIKQGIGIDPLLTGRSTKKVKLISKMLGRRIPLPSEVADHVTLIAVLEHLDNPEAMLSEAGRLLKPGGTLILTTPSPLNKPLLEFLAFRLGLLSSREIGEHKRYFWGGQLVSVLRDAGFKKVKRRYFECFLNNFAVATKEK